MYIFLVTLLGLILRLNFISKPEGMWNDEYVSWFVASTPFSNGFWEEIIKQCHMPLYYLYLKPFVQCSDTVLRLTSVLPSILAIPVMYLIGKEYSTKCAKICAVITATLPFLVYYSQEVRFYSLVFLLSALILLYTIKLIKNPSKINSVLYSVSAALLVFTHVLGIFYVLILSVYLLFKLKKISIKWLLIIFCSALLVLPFGLNILRQLPSSQWWGIFSYTNIMFLFSDFLSPILSNNVNAPPVFFYKTNILFILLLTVPTIMGIYGIIIGFKKTRDFLILTTGFVLVISLIALTGKLVFITKYLIEILPVIILAISVGFEGNKFKSVLLCAFVFINLFAIFTPYYPSKNIRTEGNKLPAIILNEINPDNIIFTYYAPDRFTRYLNVSPKMKYISKINRFEYINNPSEILSEIKSGESTAIVFLDSVSFLPQNMTDESQAKKIPEMFVTFSKIRHSLENTMVKDFSDVKNYKLGSWTILTGKNK